LANRIFYQKKKKSFYIEPFWSSIYEAGMENISSKSVEVDFIYFTYFITYFILTVTEITL